jgi:hypothetical protein
MEGVQIGFAVIDMNKQNRQTDQKPCHPEGAKRVEGWQRCLDLWQAY